MDFLIFIGSIVGLVFSGDWLVDGASGVAYKAKLSKAFIGLTIVSAGTSAPELVVSLFAILSDKNDISMGNIIGSNIFNIAAILGLTAMIYPIAINKKIFKSEIPFLLFSSILFYLFVSDGILKSWEAGILFAFFIGFIIYSHKNAQGEDYEIQATKKNWLNWLMVLGGILGLALFARLMIYSAENIARSYNISERIIGLTLFALGTSVPELITSLAAAYRKENDIVLGNIIGSNIFNIMLVLGAVGIIQPITASEKLINFDIYWMLGITFILLPILFIFKKITRLEGLILFVLVSIYFYCLI